MVKNKIVVETTKDKEVSEIINEVKKDVRKRLHDMSQPIMVLSGCITLAKMGGNMKASNIDMAAIAIDRLMSVLINFQIDFAEENLDSGK